MTSELTPRALGLGVAAGALLAAANVYAGLKLGVVDAGATAIALLAFAAFGARARRFTPQEASVAVAAGSSAAVMAVTAGLIGPIPALALTGHEIAPITMALWGAALAGFGTLVALPFRDGLVIGDRLAFPSARATGELIRGLFGAGRLAQPVRDPDSMRVLAIAAAGAAAITVARDALGAVPGGVMLPVVLAGFPAAQLSIGVAASPLLAGVGLFTGARVGISMLAGTVIAWLIAGPALVSRGIAAPRYGELIGWLMWPGAALMVAASLTSLAFGSRQLVRAAIARPARAPARRVQLAAVLAAVAVIAIAWRGFGISPGLAGFAVVLAAVFSVAAMHATGETDNTPAGPLGGLTQIAVGGLGPLSPAVPLTTGAAVNGAAVHAATMLNACKTGSLVGSRPARLVIAQLAGIAGGAVASVLAYLVVREAYGLGTPAMPAPGALSWQATARAVAGGTATMPAGAPLAALAGAAAGIALVCLERSARLRRWVPSAIAIGVGFIVPASIGAGLAISALGFAVVRRRAPAWHARSGPALASGLIVGEALAGVAVAACTVVRAVGKA